MGPLQLMRILITVLCLCICCAHLLLPFHMQSCFSLLFTHLFQFGMALVQSASFNLMSQDM